MHDRRKERQDSTPSSADMTAVELDGFHPVVLAETYQLPTTEHVQLAPGLFRASLMSAQLGVSRVNWGSYNMPLLVHGEIDPGRGRLDTT